MRMTVKSIDNANDTVIVDIEGWVETCLPLSLFEYTPDLGAGYDLTAEVMSGYQPKTGAKCGCKRGIERDNCPNCEGTGMVIDFKAIRARRMNNPNCDGAGPHDPNEVRVLPTGADSNAILCRFCFCREKDYRLERNKELEAGAKFDLPMWDDLKVYSAE